LIKRLSSINIDYICGQKKPGFAPGSSLLEYSSSVSTGDKPGIQNHRQTQLNQ